MQNRFSEPKDFKWGKFEDDEGRNIRYGHIKTKLESKGTMIILPGFREPVEKYFETIRDMLDRGYDIWTIDWLGQGGSDRFLEDNGDRTHSESFDKTVKYFDKFIKEVVKPKEGDNLILNAHSMGAHLGLRYIQEFGKDLVKSAIISAPMFMVKTEKYPRAAAKILATFGYKTGGAEKYVPGAKDYNDKDFDLVDSSVQITGINRYKSQMAIFKARPDLRASGPTYGWLYNAFKSMDILNDKKYLEEIEIPILMATPLNDDKVELEEQEKASKIMKNCKMIKFEDAGHEIWMESDKFRNKWLEEVDSFLAIGNQAQKLDVKKKPNPSLKVKGL